jgi:hypothetical protein
MGIAAGASNLFFNRDTKVFVSQTNGRPVSIGSTVVATNAVTSAAVHGMATGDRIMLTAGLGTITGITAGTVYYAIVASTTTFKFAASITDAIAGTTIAITGTPSSGFVAALDSFQVPTAVVTNGTTAVLTMANHSFVANDVITLYGVTDNTNLDLNGVYLVQSVVLNTSITVNTAATAGTLATPGTIKVIKSNIWEIPVLAGYSASQKTTTSEITLNEMTNSAGVSRRGRQMFNNAISPTDWSFDTYIRPYKATNQYAVEEPLWANLVAKNYALNSGSAGTQTSVWGAGGVTRGATDLVFDFSKANVTTLGTFDIYFILGANKISNRDYALGTDAGSHTIYKVTDAVINECSMSFAIDGISTISWTGMGSAMTECGAFYGVTAGNQGVSATNNFIRNRLTALTLVGTTPAITATVTLTGGTVSISNNMSYLTPETLGQVNKPLAHITGTRTIKGTFTAYMDEVSNGTIDLFQSLAEKANTVVTNQFALSFYVGGQAATDLPNGPGIQIKVPTAHLEIPSVNFDDVVSTEVTWHALPSTISGADEISAVRYVGINP